ncbi:ABC transporter ATP-binding protein/permease [Gemella sp. zg-570]|uniref:ABC transporter ATP-binding protein n=1 Tax=Gemella sp. zg-570 TaxID=2840371 RepID=UPI001C0C2F0E|nr:ABC transporter ATP-binding protein [Gemella sp. zg-570]QWQ38821.1 ABC transporter ATP-binding protein/permease [Gemella sp. zg-570]
MTSLASLKQLLNLTKELKKPLIKATIFGSLAHISLLVFTFLLALIFLNRGWSVYLLAVLAFLLAFIKGFSAYAEQLLNHYVAFKILHILRIKVLEKFKKISLDKFLKNNSGDYMTVITNDIEILEVFYAHTISPFFIFLVQTFVLTTFLAFFSLKLALLPLIIYLIMGLALPLIFKNSAQSYGDNYRKQLADINKNSKEEAYSIFESIQYQKIDAVKEKLNKETDALTSSSYRKNLFQINLNFINMLIYNLAVISFIFAAKKHLSDTNTIIALVAMFIVSFTPIFYMGNLASTLSPTMAAGKRFLELINLAEEEENSGNIVDFKELKVDKLNFSYGKKKIIDNLSFSAKKGQIVGLVGDSGRGKSTLAKLIMKFLPLEDGQIKIDGVDISKIDNTYFRKNSSIIMQDTYMFNTTLAKNIALFDKKIDNENLYASLEATNLKNFVQALPKKEEEIIGEGSSNISSGQKQRLSTTRSLYSKSKLLILDEATANIDVFSEIELLKTLEKIKKDKIILIISHNKSTLSICDKIVEI